MAGINRKSLLYLIIAIALAVLIGVSFFYIFRQEKEFTIADCKDIECVKNYAKMPDFYVGNCQEAPAEFRDQCYYTYGTENPLAAEKSEFSQYCKPIEDPNLRADCFYRVTGATIMTEDIRKKLLEAMYSLNPENCDNIPNLEWQEQCRKDIPIIQEAVDEKDTSICTDNSVDLSHYARQLCIKKVQDLDKIYE